MQVVARNEKPVAAKPKAKSKRKPKLAKAITKVSNEKYGLALTTIALLVVSLVHLADGVVFLTDCPLWQGWAMALGIDAMFVACEISMLKQGSCHWGNSLVTITLAVSAYLNALGFSHNHFDQDHLPAIGFGIFIPLAMFLATHRLARLK